MTPIGKIIAALQEAESTAESANQVILAYLVGMALDEARDVEKRGGIAGIEVSSRITPPKGDEPYPDRYLDCQMALEDGLQDLVDEGIGAGWRPLEVIEAIEALCTANGRGRGENGTVDANLMLMNIMAKRKQQ